MRPHWDDHDYGPNNSDRGAPGRSAALAAYREHVPHYPLVSGRTINQAFTMGRVRFLLTDLRADRDGPAVPPESRTLLGEAQRAWLLSELAEAGRYGLVVWASSVGWLGDGGDDDWGGFPAEREAVARFLMEHRVKNLLMVSGDAHMLAIDDGSHNTFLEGGPGFPLFHAAALDQKGSDKGGPFSHPAGPGRRAVRRGGRGGRRRVGASHVDGAGPRGARGDAAPLRGVRGPPRLSPGSSRR